MANAEELLEVSEKAADLMKHEGEGLLTESFLQDFEIQYDNLKDKAKDIMNPDRDLHVGIVGQVKAGKSSFLNAILFDGKEVLPKAATPMTAGLTKIVYSEKEYARVCYYNEWDWNGIKKGSDYYDQEFARGCEQKKQEKAARADRMARMQKGGMRGRMQGTLDGWKDKVDHARRQILLTESEKKEVRNYIPEKLRACKELVEMAQQEGEDELLEKLGTEEEIPFPKLADYIGAHGRYAPIVKSIEVGVHMPDVKDLEIIDTPGLGDPIISRSERTRQFLMKCDLVILLSTASQFMKESDVSLIANTLSENSIQQVCFVASRFDEAMLEDPGRERQDVIQVYKRTRRKLNKTLHDRLEDYGRKVSNPLFQTMLRQLEAETAESSKAGNQHPNCTAALLFIAARKKEQGIAWTEEEAHVIDQMMQRFDRMTDDADMLKSLAGIERFKEKEFLPLRDKKEALIQQRQAEFISDQRKELMRRIEDIRSEAESNLRQLKEGDIASVQEKIKQARAAIAKMRQKLRAQFDASATEASQRLIELANDIRLRSKEFEDVDIEEKVQTIQHTKEHWFTKDEHWEETVRTKTVAVHKVLHNIDAYIDDANALIARNMGHAVDIDGMQRNVRDIVVDGFVSGHADFAPDDISRPVTQLLRRNTLPPYRTVDKQKYQDIILQEFSDGSVEGGDIHRLMTANEKVLNQIKEDIVQELQALDKHVQDFMSEQSLTFADDVEKQIVGTMELLQENLKHQQENVQRYEAFIASLKACKEEYRNMK